LLPDKHIVDTGYLDADLLVRSKLDHEVELRGPTRADYKWQARAATGFDAGSFQIDWGSEQATCPAGRTSLSWTPAVDKRSNEVVKIKFSMKDCQPCASRAKCTRANRRTITVRRQDQYVALQAARAREETAEYKTEYRRRAGIEGTLSQGIRACGLRRSRYRGEAKTHLQHVLTAAAINLVRIYHWLTGTPIAKTRQSSFTKMVGQPAHA
jgi:transposase